MKDFYGPYFAKDGEDVWHWHKECPDFPAKDCVSLLTSKKPEEKKLCPVCGELECKKNSLQAE